MTKPYSRWGASAGDFPHVRIEISSHDQEVGLEPPVQGLGLEPRGLAHPPGRPAGRRRQQDRGGLGFEDVQDGVDQRGLAHARPAGDHQQLRAQREAHRLLLAPGQGDPGPGLGPGDGLLGVDRGPGQGAGQEPQQPLGYPPLGAVEPGQEHARPLLDRVGHLLQPLGCLLDGVEHGLAERLDELSGVDRADALDHAEDEVLLDALQRGGRGRSEEGGLERQAAGAVVHPGPAGLDELADADRRRGTDHGDEVTLAAHLDPQHAEAGLGTVEGTHSTSPARVSRSGGRAAVMVM
jgi:hypothetical protein